MSRVRHYYDVWNGDRLEPLIDGERAILSARYPGQRLRRVPGRYDRRRI